MNLCAEYDHPATVQRTPDGPRWLERPERCHVTRELTADPEALAFLEKTYALTDGCRGDLLHADLLVNAPAEDDETPEAELARSAAATEENRP